MVTQVRSSFEWIREFWVWLRAHREYANQGQDHSNLPAKQSLDFRRSDQTDRCRPNKDQVFR